MRANGDGFYLDGVVDGVYTVRYEFDTYCCVTNTCWLEVVNGVVTNTMDCPVAVPSGRINLMIVDAVDDSPISSLVGRYSSDVLQGMLTVGEEGKVELNLPPGDYREINARRFIAFNRTNDCCKIRPVNHQSLCLQRTRMYIVYLSLKS